MKLDKIEDALSNVMTENLLTRLADNPCRGIVCGLTPDHEQVQFSWIMGRKPNSQNRRYVVEGKEESSWLETVPFDASKVEDPSLIIYTVMNNFSGLVHIVSNGSQTDAIVDAFGGYKEFPNPTTIFEDTLKKFYCEPDSPIFTPRITGMQIASGTITDQTTVYLSLLKAEPFARALWTYALEQHPFESFLHDEPTQKKAMEKYLRFIQEETGLNRETFPTQRFTFANIVQPGMGYCLTTYAPGHEDLPSFKGEPFLVPITSSVQETMQNFWNHLEPEWRVGVGGKVIHSSYGQGVAGGYELAPPINRHAPEKKD